MATPTLALNSLADPQKAQEEQNRKAMDARNAAAAQKTATEATPRTLPTMSFDALQAATQDRIARAGGSPNAPVQTPDNRRFHANEAGINTPLGTTVAQPGFAKSINAYSGDGTSSVGSVRYVPSDEQKRALAATNPEIFKAGTPQNAAFVKAWREGHVNGVPHNNDAVSLAQKLFKTPKGTAISALPDVQPPTTPPRPTTQLPPANTPANTPAAPATLPSSPWTNNDYAALDAAPTGEEGAQFATPASLPRPAVQPVSAYTDPRPATREGELAQIVAGNINPAQKTDTARWIAENLTPTVGKLWQAGKKANASAFPAATATP